MSKYYVFSGRAITRLTIEQTLNLQMSCGHVAISSDITKQDTGVYVYSCYEAWCVKHHPSDIILPVQNFELHLFLHPKTPVITDHSNYSTTGYQEPNSYLRTCLNQCKYELDNREFLHCILRVTVTLKSRDCSVHASVSRNAKSDKVTLF